MGELRRKKILDTRSIERLFGNLEMIVPVNEVLLRALEERYEQNIVVETIGDILLRVVEFFKIYSFYCTNYPEALVFLQTLRSREFLSELAALERNPRLRSLNLASFLIKPIQRICKYPLLIRVSNNVCIMMTS